MGIAALFGRGKEVSEAAQVNWEEAIIVMPGAVGQGDQVRVGNTLVEVGHGKGRELKNDLIASLRPGDLQATAGEKLESMSQSNAYADEI